MANLTRLEQFAAAALNGLLAATSVDNASRIAWGHAERLEAIAVAQDAKDRANAPPNAPPALLQRLADAVIGKITEVSGPLPDGSGFATMSMPLLPKTHWIYAEHKNVPPMPWRTGTANRSRKLLSDGIVDAARYAIRCATMNGKEMDFDPDDMVQTLVVGLLGYQTADGLSSNPSCNPCEMYMSDAKPKVE